MELEEAMAGAGGCETSDCAGAVIVDSSNTGINNQRIL
jgi:hypothetical protein